MILVFDVGNTNIVVAVFEGDNLLHQWRFYSDVNKTDDEYKILLGTALAEHQLSLLQVKGAILSSVVPRISQILIRMARKLIGKEILQVSPSLNLGISIDTAIPEQVGQDRIVSAAAAYYRFKTTLIVIDFGTATTFDIVTESGSFQGGIICPGMTIIVEALATRTAQLFHVELEPPRKLIGDNTTDSIKSGLYHGYVGMVESLIIKLTQELHPQKPVVVATGGLSKILVGALPAVDHWIDDLILQGLHLIYKMNQP